MQQGQNLEIFKVGVQEYISNIYFDTQSCTAPITKSTEDYVIRLISKLVISIYSSWYAITEIILFLKKRKDIKGIH